MGCGSGSTGAVWATDRCERRSGSTRPSKAIGTGSATGGPSSRASGTSSPNAGPLARSQHAELVAVGIGQDDPADVALADVDPLRPERDETFDLGLLITVGGWGEVEVPPVLAGLRRDGGTAPRHLRAALRRLDRGLLVLITHQRPAQRVMPAVADLLRPVARHRADEPGVGEEVVARLDDAELVALGVGEHHMQGIGTLPDVEVPATELERPRHGGLLLRWRGTGEIEVHPVLAGPWLLGGKEL